MRKRERRTRSNSPVAESIVHTWVGEVQFNRGLNYVVQGMLKQSRRRGFVISALCEGKRNGPQKYRVRATVVEGKIEEAFCTCSIGKYGVCPHIAAILIHYSRNPEQFQSVNLLNAIKSWLGLKA